VTFEVACVPLQSVRPFFRRRKLIEKTVDWNRPNPLDEFALTFKDYKPINIDFPRFLHFDLAVSGDNAGVACCHASHFVERVVSAGVSNTDRILVPFIYFDFLGRIQAPKGGEIMLDDVVNIIYQLAELGVYIALVTFDRFQSVSQIQRLKADGFTATNLSVDRTAYRVVLDKHSDDGYRRDSTNRQYIAAMQCFKDAVYQRRCSVPAHEHYINEAKRAEYDERTVKVTHNVNSTIDLLQAMAGSAYNCENNAYPPMTDMENYSQSGLGDNFYDINYTESYEPELEDDFSSDSFYKEFEDEKPF